MATASDFWPRRADYQNAVLYPRYNLRDQRLHATEVEKNLRVGGVAMPSLNSGNFGAVYKFNGAGRAYALKVFAKAQHDRELRYSLIDHHLASQPPSPSLVSFSYDPQGIKVNDRWFPTLVMDWVAGRPLFKYIDETLQQRGRVENGALCRAWVDLVAGIEHRRLAHGDLQHGNVIVLPDGSLKLVDYDGMFVPAMRARGMAAIEAGLPAYQHPLRASTPAYFDERLDDFSALVILLTFASLDRDRWQRYHTDDCLIIGKRDLANPEHSAVLAELAGAADQPTAKMARILRRAARGSLDEIPPFQRLLSDGTIREVLHPAWQPVAGGRVVPPVSPLPPLPPVPPVPPLLPPPPTAIDLTQRERDVLEYVTAGFDDGRIAMDLGLQPATVQGHVRSAQKKVGVATRRDLMSWGAAHGYGQRVRVAPPPPPPPPPPVPPRPTTPAHRPLPAWADTLRWVAAIAAILALHASMDLARIGTGHRIPPSLSLLPRPTAEVVMPGEAAPGALPTASDLPPAPQLGVQVTTPAPPPSGGTAPQQIAPGSAQAFATVAVRNVAPPVVPAGAVAGANGTRIGRVWIEQLDLGPGQPDVAVHVDSVQVAQADSRRVRLVMRFWSAGNAPIPASRSEHAVDGQLALTATEDVTQPVATFLAWEFDVSSGETGEGQGIYATVEVVDAATNRVLARARSEGTFTPHAAT